MGMDQHNEEAEFYAPLLPTTSPSKDDYHHQQQLPPLKIKTGTRWTATAHIITGVIGAGVLSLSWSIAQLGWLVGVVSLLVFAGVTLVSVFLLCDCYRAPDPTFGPYTNPSYIKAVRHFLGGISERICEVVVQQSLYGTTLAYTITAGVSMRYTKEVEVKLATSLSSKLSIKDQALAIEAKKLRCVEIISCS